MNPSSTGPVDGSKTAFLSELLLADPSAFYSELHTLTEPDRNERDMLALTCCIPCHVSPLVLNPKRMERVLLTEQRPQRPQPLVSSLQFSRPPAHWWRGGFRRTTWQRKEGPARTPCSKGGSVCLEPPTLLSVSPYHSMKVATLGVWYHAACVWSL